MSDTGDYGGKAVIAGVSRGYPRDDLETKSLGSVDKSRAVAEVCLPGRIGESLSDITLDGAVYVGKGQIYVGTFGESVVVNCRDGDFLTRNLRQFGNRNTMRLQFTSVTNSVYLDFVDEFRQSARAQWNRRGLLVRGR
ncbi:hypothetical protein [Rhodococcus sp. ARC_M6]|uniref:DUF6928 family protein n=1 Tax=Rhodococcus sp. ARC_M6 TaxID=2928852 RepID=UPI001FB215C2|nr:hypothetical protein [Rhodococcus sp. ARC_M6]MCJ0903302.1 hypothetical protein [Rhodococcus sp. ARC_M6]